MGFKDQSVFIRQIREVHGDRYDYSLVVYTGASNKIRVICKTHGEFSQVASTHLKGAGCRSCYEDTISKRCRKTNDEFIKQSKARHGETYDYSKTNYLGNSKAVFILCRKHGEFRQFPNNHIKGSGCPNCRHEKRFYTQDKFLLKCLEVHGNKYDYSKSVYTFYKNEVVIGCKVHGDFRQRVALHLAGAGCPSCVVKGFRRSDFVKVSKQNGRCGKAKFYLVEFLNSSEEPIAVKVGITTQNLEGRFKAFKKIGLRYKLINFVEGDATTIYDLERKFLRENTSYRCSNKLPENMEGRTECFDIAYKDLIISNFKKACEVVNV